MLPCLATLPPAVSWVRVDDPDHPDAIARSATGALLEAPPPPGTPWRWASVPVPDGEVFETAGVEAVRATNADLWHAAGVTGAGVKVAVVDIGWSTTGVDPTTVGEVSRHDCFLSRACEVPFDPLRPAAQSPLGPHGWACAEVVRAVAPDAELYLVRANTLTMLENAVAWAIREGIDVITMSMSYFNDSFYDGAGPHAELMRQLEAADVLMVTSAGNTAQQSWSGPFLDGDGDGRLDGQDNGLWLDIPRSAAIQVSWNQFGRCGDTDLDAFVVDEAGLVVAASTDPQEADADRCEPVEVVRVPVVDPGRYRLEVHHRGGSRVGLRVQATARAGRFEHPVARGSVTDPAAHPAAVAVGAVWVADYADGPPEPFSSRGPTHAGVPKPELVGPDGLSTSGYGPGGFFGTSASTPVVAGLVALVRSDDPTLTNREAFERIEAWSRPPAGPAFAPAPGLGAGRARLAPRDTERGACGQRPLILPVLLLPLAWLRRAMGAPRREAT